MFKIGCFPTKKSKESVSGIKKLKNYDGVYIKNFERIQIPFWSEK